MVAFFYLDFVFTDQHKNSEVVGIQTAVQRTCFVCLYALFALSCLPEVVFGMAKKVESKSRLRVSFVLHVCVCFCTHLKTRENCCVHLRDICICVISQVNCQQIPHVQTFLPNSFIPSIL